MVLAVTASRTPKGFLKRWAHVFRLRKYTQIQATAMYVETNLNEICIGLHENVRELIRCVFLVKKRINVIVLNKVTSSSTDKVNCTRYYWWSIGFSSNSHYLVLVFLVVLQLLSQRNCMLHHQNSNNSYKQFKKKETKRGYVLFECKWKYI